MKKTWKIILLIVLIVLALGIIGYLKASAKSDSGTSTSGSDSTATGTKILGSATSSPFPTGSKLYANTAVNIRKGAGVTSDVLKTANAGTFIGTTTGSETRIDTTAWVEVKLSDSTKAYVSKNYTYILN